MAIGVEEFRWAAGELGLKMEPAEPSFPSGRIGIEGVLDGIRVSIAQWRGQFVYVEFNAFLAPSADLHLSIAPAGIGARLRSLFGKHDIEVGDNAFDSAFDVHAHEPERALAMLTPEVRAVLLPWKDAGEFFRVDDERVYLCIVPGAYSTADPQTIVQNTRAAAGLARLLSAALRLVPASKVLAPHVEKWRAFGAAHGLAFAGTPLSLNGVLPGSYRESTGMPLSARAVPISKDGYGVALRVGLAPPLSFFLRVRSARWFDVFERTGQSEHVKTGDATFDHELRVTTDDADAAKTLLDDRTRAALLALHHDHSGIVLDPYALEVRTKTMIEPAEFASLAERAENVVRALERR